MNLKSLFANFPISVFDFYGQKKKELICIFARIQTPFPECSNFFQSGPKIWNIIKTNRSKCALSLDFNIVNFGRLNMIMIIVQINFSNRSYIKMCKIDFRPSSSQFQSYKFLIDPNLMPMISLSIVACYFVYFIYLYLLGFAFEFSFWMQYI